MKRYRPILNAVAVIAIGLSYVCAILLGYYLHERALSDVQKIEQVPMIMEDVR